MKTLEKICVASIFYQIVIIVLPFKFEQVFAENFD